ncbi:MULTISPECIES: DsbA family protein [Microvirga]|uniref:Thioredoxin domain-containing protein n=2 Tax=Microvirga TaxID=186650 RepID=A0ABW9Z400_9HYPH|nr:DsbA family protein [Microvirga arsenatis]NBJ13782.1 thioredoxin domain-containing protein [Microvirga arsenatis]NBJ27255.1 thioredoxin domain-containing protein [Microvirga arsenatis]
MDFDRRRMIQGAALALLAPSSLTAARAQSGEGWHPLKGDDGKPVANARLPVELTGEIEHLPGVIWVGSKSTAVTLYEFHDYNCPYCRVAAKDLHLLVKKRPELRLGLINNAILSLGSMQAAKVELALFLLKGPAVTYEFHHHLFAMPGTNDGTRALKVAEDLGVPRRQIEPVADSEKVGGMLREQIQLAANLGLAATPSFVAGGIGVLGYPGSKTIGRIVAALDRCGEAVCPA